MSEKLYYSHRRKNRIYYNDCSGAPSAPCCLNYYDCVSVVEAKRIARHFKSISPIDNFTLKNIMQNN